MSFARFLDGLPDYLAAKDFRAVVEAIARARRRGAPVLLGIGAHFIKVGLSPLLLQGIRNGVFTAVAMNGAGVIHDVELALAGKTSEDVAACLSDGSFGMAKETAQFIHGARERGDVADEADKARRIRAADAADGEGRREHRAIATLGGHLAADADDSRIAGFQVPLHMTVVCAADRLGHEEIHVATDDLRGGVTEQRFGGVVERLNAAPVVDHDDGIHGRIQQRPQFLGAAPAGVRIRSR